MWRVQPCSTRFNKPLNETLPGETSTGHFSSPPQAGPSDQAEQLPPLQQKSPPQEQALKAAVCLLPSSQPQRCLPREMREPSSLLPMLSTPRGMITSAYFFVCKTETVVEEAVNVKSQLHSNKKQPMARKLGKDGRSWL